MIKTRLVGLLSHAKKYIVYTILWQWAALLSQVIAVWCGNGSGCETDDFYTGNCCCDPLFLRADGRAVVVSCVCGCEADSARKNL